MTKVWDDALCKTVSQFGFYLVSIEKMVQKSIIASTTIAPNSLKPNQVTAPLLILSRAFQRYQEHSMEHHGMVWFGMVWFGLGDLNMTNKTKQTTLLHR
jgi:hypothetical protein